MVLNGKRIVLGVTGSIAAYKAADIASQLTRAGACVNVIMTDEAEEFISPITFRSLTGNPVVTGVFDRESEYSIEHVSLAQSADIVVIAPATANTIAKLAVGIADDMLTCTVLATQVPVVLAPAMNTGMYENSITQENITKLKSRGFVIVGPGSGWLACGLTGTGRMSDPEEIIGTTRLVLGRSGDLVAKHLVITAGGTQEPIDPVRILTNRSSGKMGYALAEAARDRGAKVTLVSAPTALPKPVGIKVVEVITAQDMYKATRSAVGKADALIMTAAVADYRPVETQGRKIKKAAAKLSLELERTPDIIASVNGKLVKVGFAAETENLIENAMNKLSAKGLHLIVANNITEPGTGFGADLASVTTIDRQGHTQRLRRLSKAETADRILDKLKTLLITPTIRRRRIARDI